MGLPDRNWARALIDRCPARAVQMAVRVRDAVAPQPWPYDEAAIELYRQERRGRGLLSHPAYLYGLLTAARTARAVGIGSITVLEFGVAGGNGLLALRRYADQIGASGGPEMTVVGLDSGAGLLPATDPRDCGFALAPGAFAMDQDALSPHLEGAELILGDVAETVWPLARRIADGQLPPLGFVAHDLDVYTGTRATLDALGALPVHGLLPRVPMYFDDLSGYPYTTESGERAAISEFNRSGSATRKVGRIENLEHTLGGSARWANWPRQVHVLHAFDHPDYEAPERFSYVDLGLRGGARTPRPETTPRVPAARA